MLLAFSLVFRGSLRAFSSAASSLLLFFRFGGPIGGRGFIQTERDQSATLGKHRKWEMYGVGLAIGGTRGSRSQLVLLCWLPFDIRACKTCNFCAGFSY